MRGDEVHRELLSHGFRWDMCEQYVLRVSGAVDLILEPNVRSFPAQRHVPWTIWLAVPNSKGNVVKIWVGTAKTYGELAMFAR